MAADGEWEGRERSAGLGPLCDRRRSNRRSSYQPPPSPSRSRRSSPRADVSRCRHAPPTSAAPNPRQSTPPTRSAPRSHPRISPCEGVDGGVLIERKRPYSSLSGRLITKPSLLANTFGPSGGSTCVSWRRAKYHRLFVGHNLHLYET